MMEIRDANGNIILSETYDSDHPERYFVVADSSYRFREIMGDNTVVLNFSLTYFVDFPIGCRILYENETYTMLEIANVTKANERQYEYTLTFYNPAKQLARYKFRNMVDGRLNFTLTAHPQEFIDLICDNLNARNTGELWTRGDYIESAEKTQSFSHNTILDALSSIAQLFETEWEIKQTANGYSISIKKVEYNKATAETNNAQRLSYGKGNGFVSGITRQKGNENTVDCVWVEGGDRNIDSQTYIYEKIIEGQTQTLHANKLRLPRQCTAYYIPPTSDTDKGSCYLATDFAPTFDIDAWIAENNPIILQTDEDGFGLHRRTQDYLNNGFEESLELTDIYPHLKLNVTDAILEGYNDGKPDSPDPEKYSNRFWNITAADNPVNYNDYMIGGETATIIFNSGMLSGKEFNLANQGSEENPKIYNPTGQLFLIQPTEIDGITMPDLPIDIRDKDQKAGTGYIPAVGDEFAVFHVALPQEYIDKAERELLLEACHYLYKHGEVEVEFNGTVDGIWARNKWETMRQYFVLGGYIKFYDNDLCRDGRLLRILSIKDYITRPHAPELTLSNSTVSASVSSELKKIAQNQAYNTTNVAEAVQFSKRNFRAAQSAQDMINKAYSAQLTNIDETLTEQITQVVNNLDISNSYFTENINPATIQTMSMLIGDKNLQFAFGHADTDAEDVVTRWTRCLYQPWWEGGALHCPNTVSLAGGAVAAHVRHDYWTANKDANVLTVDALGNHPYWIVNAATLSVDGNNVPLQADKAYYLYLQAPSGAATAGGFGKLQYSANFVLYSEPHPSPSGDDFYFLVGILNADFGGSRSYVDIYSSVEITGGMIRLDKIVSQDGSTYIDLINNTISGRLVFHDGLISSAIGIGNSTNAYAGVGGKDKNLSDESISLPWLPLGETATKYDSNVALWAGKWLGKSAQINNIWASLLILEDGTVIARRNSQAAGYPLMCYIDPASGNVLITKLYSGTVTADNVFSDSMTAQRYAIARISSFSPYVYADNFVKQFTYNGRNLTTTLPSLVWGGKVRYNNAAYSATAYDSNFAITVTASRVDVGIVKLVFSSNLPNTNYFVTALGFGDNPIYATIKEKTQGYVSIILADDNTRNDDDFDLQIWYFSTSTNYPGVYDTEKGKWIK